MHLIFSFGKYRLMTFPEVTREFQKEAYLRLRRSCADESQGSTLDRHNLNSTFLMGFTVTCKLYNSNSLTIFARGQIMQAQTILTFYWQNSEQRFFLDTFAGLARRNSNPRHTLCS